MAIEAVKRIKEAEDEAEALVRAAQAEAREAVRQAEAHRDDRTRQIQKEAADARQQILAKADEEARLVCEPLTAGGEAEIDGILNPDSRKFDEAVLAVMGAVTEGIVGSRGDR